MLAGFIGGLLGFILVELLLDYAVFSSAAYGAAVGAALGMAEGFFRKDRARMLYGLRAGALLGLVAGIVSGLLAEVIYSWILSQYSANAPPSFSLQVLARALAWCIFGMLLGAAHGIKENTRGDVKYGLIGGAIGGAVGGLICDPVARLVPFGEATASRFVGFVALGIAIAVSVNRFREVALSRDRPEMYTQLSKRLPANPRLGLPAPGRTSVSN